MAEEVEARSPSTWRGSPDQEEEAEGSACHRHTHEMACHSSGHSNCPFGGEKKNFFFQTVRVTVDTQCTYNHGVGITYFRVFSEWITTAEEPVPDEGWGWWWIGITGSQKPVSVSQAAVRSSRPSPEKQGILEMDNFRKN